MWAASQSPSLMGTDCRYVRVPKTAERGLDVREERLPRKGAEAYALRMAPVEERPNVGVGIPSDIPRDYRFVPELLRRGGKRVETTFVTVGDESLTEKVDLYRFGEPWAAVSMTFHLIAEGPTRDGVVAEIVDMLAECVRQRKAQGDVVLSFYRPDGTSLIDSEKIIHEFLLAKQRRLRRTVEGALLVLVAVVALLITGVVRP